MKKKPLDKPGKLRPVMPRVCGSCKFFEFHEDGFAFCQRDPETRIWDTGDMKYWFQVCNKWARDQ